MPEKIERTQITAHDYDYLPFIEILTYSLDQAFMICTLNCNYDDVGIRDFAQVIRDFANDGFSQLACLSKPYAIAIVAYLVKNQAGNLGSFQQNDIFTFQRQVSGGGHTDVPASQYGNLITHCQNRN